MKEIRNVKEHTPKYMVPSAIPSAVYEVGALSNDVCDNLIDYCMGAETYSFHGCDAITREQARPLSDVFDPILDFGLYANDGFFRFELRNFDLTLYNTAAWLQTYEVGDSYLMHKDSEIGQSRKLTVVALLTDSSEYEEGDLQLIIPPEVYNIPRNRGTMVAFPSWVLHQVTPVEQGIRQTINLGFWGPPFK
jgi:hypothetical protein